jgi:hypothetical protein
MPASPAAAKDDAPKRTVPVVTKFPPPGNFLVQPTGPGYYTGLDFILGNERENPPKYPYPRFGIMPFPFFDASFAYLDDPNNTDTDLFDSIKRIHVGDHIIVNFGGEFRERLANETNSRLLNAPASLAGTNNNYDLTRARAYMDVWYDDCIRVYVEYLIAQTQNQNLPPLITDHDDSDLLNAFVDLKCLELFDNPVYFRFGRQELLYGSQRLISPLDWANTLRTFQGGKLFYRSEDFDADVFCVQPVVPNFGHFSSVDNQQIFTGAWLTYRPAPGQVMDAYYLDLDNSNLAVATGFRGRTGCFNDNTIGARYAGDTRGGILWDFEGMYQFGSWVNQHINATAYTGGLGYGFKDCCLTPTFWVYYDFASGDPFPNGTDSHQTFNQLFPFNHYYFGQMDLVGRQNIKDFHLNAGFYPMPWITCLLEYHMLRLDSPTDFLYNSAGVGIRRDPTGRAGTDVGDLLQVVTDFHLDNHSDIFVSYGHLFVGDFIRNTAVNFKAARSPDYLYCAYCFRF